MSNVEKKESIDLLEEAEKRLCAAHLFLSLFMKRIDDFRKEHSGAVYTKEVLEDFANAANATTMTDSALQSVRNILGRDEKSALQMARKILGMDENGQPVEQTKEAGAV